MRISAFLDALGWSISLWTDNTLVHYIAYLASGLAMIPYAVYPDLRHGRQTSKAFIGALALICVVGYFIALFVLRDHEYVLHTTALILVPIVGYSVYRLIWTRRQILRSHYVVALALSLMGLVGVARSILLVSFIDVFDADVSAFMLFWPALYAALFTSILASYLEEAHNEEKAKARIDGLTKIYNRNFFEESLKIEFDRRKRNDTLSSSLLMLDIDKFKLVNDNHGHAAGDLILKSVARSLSEELRETDIAGRYGGDEFAVVLVDTSASQAMLFAERIRKTIEQSQLPFDASTLNCTISLGVAEYFPHLNDHVEWMKCADQALYQSKEKGRNCVSMY